MKEQEKLNIDLEFLDKKEPTRIATKPADKPRAMSITQGDSIVAPTTAVRPWIRFWARYLDIIIFSFASGIFLEIFAPSLLNSSEFFLTILILFVWIFVEATLLSSWGTTPGKWLLRVNLNGSGGGKMDFSGVLNRSFAVWFRGLGLGIPIVSFFTLISAHNYLKKENATSWDRDGNFTVSHGKVGIIRSIVAIIIISILFFLVAGQN